MRHQPFDKAAIMRRAHKDHAWWVRHGKPRSFARCLSTAWAAAKLARQQQQLIAA
jgi:hypothetical protein